MTQIPIQKTSEKGQPNGYAALDGSGNVLDGAGDIVGGGAFAVGADTIRDDVRDAINIDPTAFTEITPIQGTKAFMVSVSYAGVAGAALQLGSYSGATSSQLSGDSSGNGAITMIFAAGEAYYVLADAGTTSITRVTERTLG